MGHGEMDLLIFDLDGTLIDSKLDLAHSVNAARNHLGLPAIDNELVYTYVGNGAPVLIRRALGVDASEQDVKTALDFFLAYYRDHMLDYTCLYPGVVETLEQLASDGARMAVLTNKPVRISQAILDGLGVSRHFFRVYGGNSFEQKKPHPIGIDTLLEETQIARDRTLMIGDSAVDIRTARNAGVRSCGVTWGFQPDSLQQDPPDVLIHRIEELLAVVRSGSKVQK
jgi:phosphoglycolate phosphatase